MYIKVRVMPGAKKDLVKSVSSDTFEITVREEPERNLANVRVRELLAAHFSMPVAKIRIITGHQCGNKILSIG